MGWVVRQVAASGRVVRVGRALKVRSMARRRRRREAPRRWDELAGAARGAGLAPGGCGNQRDAEGVDVPGRDFFPRRLFAAATRRAARHPPKTVLEEEVQGLLHAE